MKPRIIVLRTAGTNCDAETGHGFKLAGGLAELVHINELFGKRKKLSNYDILAIPGGFSYGDDIAAGKILANEIKYLLAEEIKAFAGQGKPIIGICNGFQVLVKAGLLPGGGREDLTQTCTLTFNDSGKFEDRWVYLKNENLNIKNKKCVWTKNLPEIIYLPVAHGEGKFVALNNAVLREIEKHKQVVFRYVDDKGGPASYPWNPNASANNIAGISDRQGTILGLMPHPERYLSRYNHPRWTREKLPEEGIGLIMFRNAVRYAS